MRIMQAYLLSLDHLVCLDVDVVVGFKGVDLVLWELGAVEDESALAFWREDGGSTGQVLDTYVKPLMSLNSVVIFPPWSVTCFLALSGGDQRSEC